MTKNQEFQKELQEKIKPGVKASDLKKLKRSKSLDDLSVASSNPPLPRSKSHLEIPVIQQPTLKQQITSLQDELTVERKRVGSLRESLSSEQEKNKQLKGKNKELKDQVLQLRLDNVKEFSDYLEKKRELTEELEENIEAGSQEIKKLESQLKTVNKKKLELQSQLGQELSKNAQLEMNNYSTNPDYWKYAWYSLLAILFTLWLTNNLRKEK